MKTFLQRYFNEIVGLTVMVLMAAALIAGQLNPGLEQNSIEEAGASVEIRLTVAE